MQTGWTDEASGDQWTVHVFGDLDLETGPPLRDHLASVLARSAELVVDMTAVEFCDSSGLGALVATRRRALLLDRRLVLRLESHGRVHSLLELSGLADSFELDPVPVATLSGPA